MACFTPHRVHRGEDRPDGKMNILWSGNNAGQRRITLPCGRCDGCKLERSRNWAARCMCEAQMHSANSFVTLTFDDAHLPLNRGLDVKYLQDFFKLLRYYTDVKFRYFACGEYGAKLGRPHYHALIFGYDFPDRKLHTVRNGNRLYTSATLAKAWPFGYSSVGDFSVAAAAYVARYVLKKVPAKGSDDHYVDRTTGEVLKPEFVVMSRGGRKRGFGGIGASWFEKYGLTDVFPHDRLVVQGRPTKPPRFFDNMLDKVDPQLLELIKVERLKNVPSWEESNDERLAVKAEVKKAKIKFLKRVL